MRYCFLDTETTGLKNPRTISIALYVYDDNKRIFKGYYICNPQAPIEPSASQVNGFYKEDVQDKPNFDKIWEEIAPYMENSLWVGHNVSYDNRVIMEDLKRYNIPIPKHSTLCTCENAKKIIPKTEIKDYKLDTLCNYFNIDFTNHHTATFDATACMKIYNKLVKLNGNLVTKDF